MGRLIGFLFHPNVRESEIEKLIHNIRESTICNRFYPKFKRLTENPNPHVTLRVVEIAFDHSMMTRMNSMRSSNGHCMKEKQQKCSKMNGSDHHNIGNVNCNDMIYKNISGENIKSLDEIDFDDDDDDDLAEKVIQQKNHNCNDDDTKEQMWRDDNKNIKDDNDN